MSVYRLEDTSGTAKPAFSISFPPLTACLQRSRLLGSNQSAEVVSWPKG